MLSNARRGHWAAVALCAAVFAASAQPATVLPVAITPGNLAGALAGSLSGKHQVAANGSAAYTLPIAVPPGTAGVAPILALSYSSQMEDGLFGRGWALNGLSSISRCGRSVAQDGVRDGISLTAADQFCIDGQRLMLVSGTHGGTAQYRTEIDGLSQVSSSGSDPASGPASWTVRTRDGLIYTYGGTTDSRVEAQGTNVAHTWAMSRVEDRRGNYYAVDYEEDNAQGEHVPLRIRYTGNLRTGAATYNAVRFVYEARPDPWRGYVRGSVMQRKRRLQALQTYTLTDAAGAGGNLVLDLRLGYVTNAQSGRSLLSSIAACGPAGDCLPATTFDWTQRDPAGNSNIAPGSGVWGGPAITIESSSKQPIAELQIVTKAVLGDFNGDGRTDMWYADGNGSSSKMCLSTGTAFDCQSWTGVNARSDEAVTGDFNGDGRTDVALLPSDFNTAGSMTVCLSTGSGFSCGPWSVRTAGKSPQRYMVADMNGDGRDDLLVVDFYGGYLCTSTGSGFSCAPYAEAGRALLDGDDPEMRIRKTRYMGDLNGDGLPDIVKYMTVDGGINGHWETLFSTPTGFVVGPNALSQGSRAMKPIPGASLVADYNVDAFGGYADVVAVMPTQTSGQAVLEVCQSNGVTLNCSTRPYDASVHATSQMLGDMDRDGRLDLFTGSAICQLNDVAATPCQVLQGAELPFFLSGNMKGDFNGDGLLDHAYYDLPNRQWTIRLMGNGGYPDLLQTITEGSGRVLRFEYAGIEDPAVHTVGAQAVYPQRNQTSGIAVVKRMQTSNGVGGWLTTDYRYEGARLDLQGRGSLGFSGFAAIDRTTNVTTTITLDQQFPYTGVEKSKRSVHQNGVVLEQTTNEYASVATVGTSRFIYPRSSQTVQKDLNGAMLPTRSRRVDGDSGIDAYGNVRRMVDTVTEPGGAIYETLTVTEYENREADWLLGLKRRETVSRSAPSVDAGVVPAALSLSRCSGGAPAVSPNRVTLTCRLANSGQSGSGNVSYGGPANVVVQGPPSCPAGTADCGTVTIQSGSAPATYQGVVSAVPASGTAASMPIAFVVTPTPARVALVDCTATTPTTSPTPARFSCTVRNDGQSPIGSVSYQASGMNVSGPTGGCAGSAVCGSVTVTTSGGAGSYSGTLTASADAGSTASAGFDLRVLTPPQITLTNCAANSPTVSPTPASFSCTVSNVGQIAASLISYGSPEGTSWSGPTGACAANSVCGTVTVTTGTAPATYQGTLSAAPSTGGTASMPFTLVVKPTPARVVLANCAATSPTTSPTPASFSCTVRNDGQSPIGSIGYQASGMSVSGPTGGCAGGAVCGTVTVTTGSGAGSYPGTLTASADAGSTASAGFDLRVLTPPQITLTNCAANSPTVTPTPASLSCTVSNAGQVAANLISFGSPAGTTWSGPTGACAANGVCGTVTVTTGGGAGQYPGTLSATPGNGQGTSVGVDLRVLSQPQLVFSNCAANSPTMQPNAATLSCTLSNVGQTATGAISYVGVSGTSLAGPTGYCGGGSACGTVTVTTGGSAGNYMGTVTATPAGGIAGSTGVNLTVHPPPPTLSTTPTFPQSSSGSGLPTYTLPVSAVVTNGLAPFTYQWSVIQSNNSSGLITNPTSATATLTSRMTVACESGVLIYRVAVTDALGRSASLNLTVNMRSTSPPKGGSCA
nr:FG-GAP-like repeat-containing protein [uncultured Roseateles sp.]